MKMGPKSSLLLLYFTVMRATATQFPFQLVDDYVLDFEHSLHELKATAKYKLLKEEYHAEKYNHTYASINAEEFDFIVIGSGASGSAIASRLSEIPEWRVLLLEAGAEETPVTQVPSVQPYLRSTSYNWAYNTVTQNVSCLGMEEHQCAIGTGKALGGDTATNDMLYTRGNPKDYDIWADSDLTGWCWNSVKPYFKKIEDNFAADLDRKEHHYGGPIYLENFQYSTRLTNDLLEAAHEIGIKKIDYNGKQHIGLGIPQVTTKDGKRNSASEAYLTKAERRKNITIRPLSRVINILIGPHTKEANGVTYLHDDQLFIAKATKEVILAAGAINSAQLLLLSGIGPKHELEVLDIPVHADLHVGHNLKDHISFIGLNFVTDTLGHKILHDHCQNDIIDYLKYGKGSLTTTSLELVGFLATEATKDKTGYPDVELLIKRNIYNEAHEQLQSLHITKDIYDAVWKPLEGQEGFTIEVVLLHPKSKGTLKLHDGNPVNYPLINPNYLSDADDEDIDTILAGIHEVLKLAETDTFKKLGVVLNHPKVPNCEHFKEKDDYWRCLIRHLSVSLRHVSGTAKMGPETDKEAVVDKELKVYGIHKLRVADASVIPVSISGNLMAAEYMIGEQAADIIKKDYLGIKCVN